MNIKKLIIYISIFKVDYYIPQLNNIPDKSGRIARNPAAMELIYAEGWGWVWA